MKTGDYLIKIKLYKILVIARVLVIYALNLTGLLNLKGVFSNKRSGKKKIAFQAYSTHLAQFYKSIISDLLKDEKNIEISFIILFNPQFSFRSALKLREYVNTVLHIQKKNIKFYCGTFWEKYDLIIYNDLYAGFPLRKTKKWMLSHGTAITSWMITKSVFLKTIFDFDQMLLAGPYDIPMLREHFEKTNLAVDVVSTGLPFLDRLIDPGITREAYFNRLSLDKNKKTILFAPHWGAENSYKDALEGYFDQVISILQETSCNIILKLHACSFNIVMAKGFDWKAKLKNIKNIVIDYDIDDMPSLKFSDILITDYSSRAFNSMLLDKPVILILKVDSSDLNDLEETEYENENINRLALLLMQKGAFVVKEMDDLKKVINEAVTMPELLRNERKEVVSQCFCELWQGV